MKHCLLGLTLLLSACSSLVPSGLAKLYQVSPLESDPADLAVALDLPDTVEVVPGNAKIAFAARRADTGETSESLYVLRKRDDTSTGLTILDIAAADHTRLRAQQTLIREWEDRFGDATSGSISVTFEGCKLGDGPDLDDPVSIRIRTERDGRFFPLVRGATVAQTLNVLEISDLQPC